MYSYLLVITLMIYLRLSRKMWSIELFAVRRLKENDGTNTLWYKLRNELREVGINYYISFSIPEIENVQHAIKESYFMRDLKK